MKKILQNKYNWKKIALEKKEKQKVNYRRVASTKRRSDKA